MVVMSLSIAALCGSGGGRLAVAQGAEGGLSDVDNTRLALNTVAGHLTAAQIADARKQSAEIKARQDAQAQLEAQAE
jgi:hypothetical protein